MRPSRLPKSVPDGTKYVLEARGPWVHRFIEWPNGRRLELAPRKAATCCMERAVKAIGARSSKAAA